MTARKVFMFVLIALSLLCAGCDVKEEDVKDFLDNSPTSDAVNDVVDSIVEEVEDYVNEAASDAVDMTGKLTENVPQPSLETSQNIREVVIENLDTVGQAVLDADTAAKELQACFEQCDGNYPDVAGSKVAANLVCVAECKGQ